MDLCTRVFIATVFTMAIGLGIMFLRPKKFVIPAGMTIVLLSALAWSFNYTSIC
jgi:hypothetical protein